MKYRKKPVVIEAVQWTGENTNEIYKFAGKAVSAEVYKCDGNLLAIETLEGTMYASVGDYIIKGVDGEFYPCKPDIFEKTYEEMAVKAINAEPVKHGRWIPAQDYSNGNEDIECSNCGEWFKSLELCGRLGEPNYCPVCGAKMIEEGEK